VVGGKNTTLSRLKQGVVAAHRRHKEACLQEEKKEVFFIKNTDKTQKTYMYVAEVTISQYGIPFASRIHVAEVAILQHRIPSASRDGGCSTQNKTPKNK